MKKTILIFLLFSSITIAQNSIVQQFSNAFADVAEKANPAVVTVLTDKIVKMQQFNPNNPFQFNHPFSPNNGQQERHLNALGSGVIVDALNGYILTNNHVVDDVDEIQVKLIDKRVFDAELVGSDPKSDLAILKIKADNLNSIKLGDSDKLRVGEWVMAVGSPFSASLSHTVTTGIVSALGRSNILGNSRNYENFIQTDAAINPGNSGGALLNMDGDLIGINTAIATGGYEKANRGVGFAIPSNMASKIMNDLIQKGYVVRAWLGVFIQELDDATARALNLNIRDGALISDVIEDSPAKKSGIKEGDLIIYFDGEKVKNPSNLKNLVSSTAPGTKSKITLIREGKELTITVLLEEMDNDDPLVKNTDSSSGFKQFGLDVRELTNQYRNKYGISEIDDGLVIISVNPNSDASNKGVKTGDIIKRVGSKKVNNVKDFNRLIDQTKINDTILLLIKKPNGNSRFITLKL
ncbi:MAG: Do family serine endopeptidase [Candidatus Marinimicrobia bacterium]|jgi:serine protease Do|nr:Do family serine endopeptidase [Candidatus Neomarinimicrobiota bacterium]MBT3937326.1 Do family serine endopeptidase [Candidatus Neomarinimicrobiota bacterium]MBT3961190.1 Do family serine endopeptidase [Candidatus Neomarinimicrobiota bacterium]MBT4382162.1 Do family serine endopeptidase [Candidatus Neomarinimicrobiota bacterium]MBT4635618.1 Do family serine endopeptidase [Candidatus Neomarinimicrobiota bacterium]